MTERRISAPDIRRGRNRLAATVVIGHAVKHVYMSGLESLLMPAIKKGLGLSAAQFGALVSSRQATSWTTTMGAGYLGDRFSGRAPLILGISLGLLGVSFLLAGRAPSYWLMFLAMLFVGVGPSLYHPSAIGELSKRFPERRGFAISLHGTGGIAGAVLGPLVVAGLLTFMMWRDVLQVSLFPALVAGLLIWAVMRSVPKTPSAVASQRDYFTSILGLLNNRVLLVLVLATGLRSMGESAVHGFLPVYLREPPLEFSEVRVALYLSMSQVAGLGAQPVMGYLSDRLGSKAVLIPGTAAIALLSIALSVAAPGAQLVMVILAMGAFRFSVHHIFIAAAIDAARGQVQSTVVYLIYGAGFIGTISPNIAGLISDKYGIPSAFVYGGGVALLATLVLLWLPSRAQRPAGEPVG
jgi:MFS family permease